jgi:hypothetical protein
MQRLTSKLTYANVVSTIALCIAVGGGAAFAAGKIDSSQIATGGVRTKNLQRRSVTSGKLAVGAVRSNQIAPGAVDTGELAPGAVHSGQIGAGAVGTKQLASSAIGADQIAKGAVGGDQLAPGAVGSDQLAKGAVDSAALGAGAVTPAQMQFPVALVASLSGAPLIAATTPEVIPYPLTDASWTPHGDGVDLVVGNVSVTLAPNVGAIGCIVWFEFAGNGEFGPEFHPSVEFGNRSTTEAATRTRSIEPFTVPVDPSGQAELTARMRNLGACAGPTTIESMDLRVIELG